METPFSAGHSASLPDSLWAATSRPLPSYPDLGKISWEYGWSGYLALAQDHLPKIYKRGNGFWAGIGCNGRGIGMAT